MQNSYFSFHTLETTFWARWSLATISLRPQVSMLGILGRADPVTVYGVSQGSSLCEAETLGSFPTPAAKFSLSRLKFFDKIEVSRLFLPWLPADIFTSYLSSPHDVLRAE